MGRMEPPATSDATTTVVVVPRERFSFALASLHSLLASSAGELRIVYVDGGSPRRVATALTEAAREHDFTLLRTEHWLGPNEARNLALQHARTELVAIVDNDVEFEPGWLRAL